MEKETVISAKDLSIGYHTSKGDKLVHEHLSLQLFAGELTCLLGANGTGKSTLLRTLAASQPPLSGELQILGKPLNSYTERERSRTIGIVLTDKTQSGGLTVYELVALGRQPHTGFFGRLHNEDHAIIRRMLDAVGISHKANNYIAELSDGERQKAMIAKALVQECPLILLDEPTAFLDVVSRIEIMTLLHQLAVEQHKAILLSTHDIEQALVLADRLWLLTQDNGMSCGVTEDLILSHHMDNLFNRENIKFNYAYGAYYPEVKCKCSIVVEASDDVLLHWATNALNRHGFACLSASDSLSALSKLRVNSADELIYTANEQEKTLHSFEELLKIIHPFDKTS